MDSMLESAAADDRTDYLRRGRRHAGLNDDQLLCGWVAAFKALVTEQCDETKRALSDLSVELDLRGFHPGDGLVREEMKVIREMICQGRESPAREGCR